MGNKRAPLSLPDAQFIFGRRPSSFFALMFNLASSSLAVRGAAPLGHRDCSYAIVYESANSQVQFDASPEWNQKVVVAVVAD